MPTWRDDIRYQLKFRGWTQAEAAKRIGVSPSYLSDILAGRRALTPRVAVRLEMVTSLIAWRLLFEQMQGDMAAAYAAESQREHAAAVQTDSCADAEKRV
jgi:plasmid maintenance system antidote protein VapI